MACIRLRNNDFLMQKRPDLSYWYKIWPLRNQSNIAVGKDHARCPQQGKLLLASTLMDG